MGTSDIQTKGLERFFGPLEAKIMTILWSQPDSYIKDVQHKLEQDKPLNFNTVMTVMNRLVDKGLLVKSSGKPSKYAPVHTQEQFLSIQSRELLEDLGPLVVNYMFDAMEEVDEELLDKLEQKIKSLKEGRRHELES
ncbi:transcriptional regulator [Paenibacillus sp. BIHB 4019]|uniref:Transcriptional regulator n=2 Tax=Paenibacillus sp. BIHB 4019 TaxID=1870819 RepID=A0A1B2DDM3_9BACL|nr:transcriptional regulator [Paenibacillus sp. BIHB 4019]